LTLAVTGDGHDRGPWHAEADLTVVGEGIDPSWWNWNPAPHPTPLWDRPYFVSGAFQNRSRYANLTFRYRITETDEGGNQQVRKVDTATILPGDVTSVASDSITQNWQFILLGTWVICDTFVKRFNYMTSFSANDEFGNEYPEFSSDNLYVDVIVSDVKFAAAFTALSCMGAAAAFLASAALAAASIFGIVGPVPVLLGAAGSAYTAAGVSGGIARDPPEPDLKFRKMVPVLYHRIPANLADTKELSSTAAWLTSTSRLLDQAAVLDPIHGKILGARKAKDQSALLAQTTNYLQVVTQITSEYVNLDMIAKKPQLELDKFAPPRKRNKLLMSWHKKGIPAKLRKKAMDAGLSKNTISNLEKAIKNKDVIALAVSPSILLLNTSKILSLVRAIQGNALEVMKAAYSE
jgi:hypothetical protein